MAEHTFDHERLDMYRLSIEYVGFSFGIAKTLGGINRQARDQWLRAAQSIPLNIAEVNGKQGRKDKTDFSRLPADRRWNASQSTMCCGFAMQWRMNPIGVANRI